MRQKYPEVSRIHLTDNKGGKVLTRNMRGLKEVLIFDELSLCYSTNTLKTGINLDYS